MKKILNLVASLMLLLFVFSACQKIDYIDPDSINANNDGVIKINVSGGPLSGGVKSATALGDTVIIEGGNVYTFSYTSTVTMSSVLWTFGNNGTTSTAAMPTNRYERTFVISSVTIVGTDAGGTAHTASIWLNNLPRAGGDPIIWAGKTVVSTGVYREEFWIYKNGAYFTPLDYKYKGNVTTPPWGSLITIPPADTNYRVDGNLIYPMPAGETGHWVKVLIDNPINFDAEVAPLIRVTASLGEQWCNFKGSTFVNNTNFGLMRYHVDANGNVSTTGGGQNPLMPGVGGDNYVRFDVSQNGLNIIIYQNNEVSFNGISPWIQFKNNDSWSTPLHASLAVTGFVNWSKYEIPVLDLPKRARFGSNMAAPTINPNNTSSIFYDPIYKDLFIDISVIPVNCPGGGGFYSLNIKKNE